jgi:hypothetical protein
MIGRGGVVGGAAALEGRVSLNRGFQSRNSLPGKRKFVLGRNLSLDKNQRLGAAAAHLKPWTSAKSRGSKTVSANSRYRAEAALRDKSDVLLPSNGCIGRRNTIDPASAGAMAPVWKVRNSWSAYEAGVT